MSNPSLIPSDHLVTPARYERIAGAVAGRQQGVIVLEDIYDPHNAAAVLRSCDAYGFQRVCLIFANQKPFDPYKLGKATSSSANKWLDFCVYDTTGACLADLRREGYQTIATVLDDRSESIFDADLTTTPRIAILFGNEHAGLSEVAVHGSDRCLMIPMTGMVQSLNLSVTAATVMFEITRQRRAAGMERFLLPEHERQSVQADLIQRSATGR